MTTSRISLQGGRRQRSATTELVEVTVEAGDELRDVVEPRNDAAGASDVPRRPRLRLGIDFQHWRWSKRALVVTTSAAASFFCLGPLVLNHYWTFSAPSTSSLYPPIRARWRRHYFETAYSSH
ncbi:unnamed protein product [Amoebophrya sp. A25]|nr:unnamed protein product [Amoebophrya sp. A25]|eukprot:GSA25T00019610001.1